MDDIVDEREPQAIAAIIVAHTELCKFARHLALKLHPESDVFVIVARVQLSDAADAAWEIALMDSDVHGAGR